MLNVELDAAYNRFCGIGLHQVKQELARLGESSEAAAAFRLALETEVASRRAKRAKGDHQQRLYREKRAKIREMLLLCERAGYQVEIEQAKDSGQPHVVYLYLPNCEQISWHTALDPGFVAEGARPTWDGKKYSALQKLEAGIRKSFPEICGQSPA